MGVETNSEIELSPGALQAANRSQFRVLALALVWLTLFAVYVMYVGAAAAAKVNTAWVDTATFSGAILCFGFDRSRMAHVFAAAVPLFAVAMFFRVAPLHAALLTLGCGGVIVLASCTFNGVPAAKQNVQIAVLLPLFAVAANTVNNGIAHLTPHLLDAALSRLDFGIGAAIRNWTWASPGRLAMANVFYGSLPMAVAMGIAAATGQERYRFLRALCLAALLAVPCYFLVPAVGPVHVGMPFAARNCMPSLHLTWALLVWLNARPVWLRRGALVFVAITAYATLGTGEHYVLDLIAAVPFALAVQQLSQREWPAWFTTRRPSPEPERISC